MTGIMDLKQSANQFFWDLDVIIRQLRDLRVECREMKKEVDLTKLAYKRLKEQEEQIPIMLRLQSLEGKVIPMEKAIFECVRLLSVMSGQNKYNEDYKHNNSESEQ